MGKLYNFFVRRNRNVCWEYEKYVQENIEEHQKKRLKHWRVLFALNWHYVVLKKKEPMIYKDINNIEKPKRKKKQEKKITENLPYLNGAESRSTKWTPPQDLVRTLLNYDVISFDIFDTLIFRPFDNPKTVFSLIGQELGVLDFVTIRSDAEKNIRNEKEKIVGHRETSLNEIYERIGKETGLDVTKGIETELNVEKNLCYANPYMKYVFDTIVAQDKKIILVSDMYIQENDMIDLLSQCGYTGFEKIIISSDYSCSKRDGALFERLKEYVGNEDLKIIHVGDNVVSDIQMARNAGLDTYYYENANSKGKKYRTNELSQLVGSAYRGIVNNHLHNGYRRYDAYYEFGFIYGGLFVYGFAQHIHKFAINNNIDKVLFVSRDGYIIKRVYDLLFNDISSDYILCSRISNLKLSAYCNKKDFMKEFVFRWINEKRVISIKDVIENMELEELHSELESYFDDLEDNIDKKSTERLAKFVDDYWEEILAIYEEKIHLSKYYYKSFFEFSKKSLVVDIGWKGTGIQALQNLERDYWHFGCEIYGMLAASAPTGSCVPQLQAGTLSTYLFSPLQNTSCFNWHSRYPINNILTELLVGAPMPSFKGFTGCRENYNLEFDVPETYNYPIIEKIHKGILDFALIYEKSFSEYPYMKNISGFDAYMTIKHILKDYSFIKKFFGKYQFQDSVGGTSGNSSKRIKDVFTKFNL